MIDEVVPGVVDKHTVAALHEAVGGLVGLELQTCNELVLANGEGQLVSADKGLHTGYVTSGEEVRAKGGVECAVLQNMSGGELTALIAAGIVLIGVGAAQGVVYLAPLGVPLGCH